MRCQVVTFQVALPSFLYLVVFYVGRVHMQLVTHLTCGLGWSHQIDAAIVRIMKTRKVLSHTLLITELFQQVLFLGSPTFLFP